MTYVLVENNQIVHLGPISWKPKFIQSELDDLGVNFNIPPTEQGYIKITENLELFPIAEEVTPEYNPLFEQLVGPTYTYNEKNYGYAIQYYTKQDSSIETVKNNLKQKAAGVRYTRENAGTEQTVNGALIKLDTSREKRDQFNSVLASIGDGTVEWKFDGQFVTLNKANVQSIIDSIHNHIQTQFAWEKTINDTIDAAADLDTLKTITIE